MVNAVHINPIDKKGEKSEEEEGYEYGGYLDTGGEGIGSIDGFDAFGVIPQTALQKPTTLMGSFTDQVIWPASVPGSLTVHRFNNLGYPHMNLRGCAMMVQLTLTPISKSSKE